jgi:hypothetical protein
MAEDGRAPLSDPETGAPLLLRSAAPLAEVEAALGALTRAGRRFLGPAGAAAMQMGDGAATPGPDTWASQASPAGGFAQSPRLASPTATAHSSLQTARNSAHAE